MGKLIKRRSTSSISDRLREINELQNELKVMRGVLKISKTRDVSQLHVGKILARRGLVSTRTGKITSQGKVALKKLG